MKVKLEKVSDVKTFVETTRRFKSDIDLGSGKYLVDAKSIMGLFSLNFSKPMKVLFVPKDNETEDDLKTALMDAGFAVV